MCYMVDDAFLIDGKLKSGFRYTKAGFAAEYYYFDSFRVLVSVAIFGLLFVFDLMVKFKALSNCDSPK